MRRSLLFSCALHGVIVLIALAAPPRRAAREVLGPVVVAFDATTAPAPAVAVDVGDVGGGGPPRPAEPAAVTPARAHRRTAVATRGTAVVAPPAPAPGIAPPAADEGQVEVTQGAPAAGAGEAGASVAGTGDGSNAGNGL